MAQVDIGGTPYDSFESVAGADLFLAGDVLRATGWALRNEVAKARGLVSATRRLLTVSWCAGVPSFTDTPQAVREATAMLAADLLAKPKLFANAGTNSNVKSAKAGSAQVEFFASVTGGPPIPLDIWEGLTVAGLVGCTVPIAPTPNDAPYVSGISGGDCNRWPYGGVFFDDDCRRGGC